MCLCAHKGRNGMRDVLMTIFIIYIYSICKYMHYTYTDKCI